MVVVPGAERSSSTIELVPKADPLRAQTAQAFSEFFFGIAREIYPHYGFAVMSEAECGVAIRLTDSYYTAKHRHR
jgi:hypothetical protein